MTTPSYTATFDVQQKPQQVFDAINDVRSWWTGDIEGRTDALGEEFTYHHEDVHRSTQQIVEFIPAKKVAWRVVDAHLSFTDDPYEWVGTEIIFEIAPLADQTQVRFTHTGLVPQLACFEGCSSAWEFFITNSLRNRIASL